MKVAYIDGNAGVSGDMLLGALIHAGWSFDALKEIPKALGLNNVVIEKKSVEKRHIVGTKIDIQIPHEHEHRSLIEIIDRINTSDLEPLVCQHATSVFEYLAKAEAEVHGVNIEEIHFHEVGAVDAMIDIVGTCRGLVQMGVEHVYASPIRLGNGYVECAHGRLPIPAPATSELIRNMQVYSGEEVGEWTTPTGAALIKEWTLDYGSMPIMTIESVGLGAGDANPEFPNLLRLFIGEHNISGHSQFTEKISKIECEIDDMPGEYFSYLSDQLLKAHVKDYFITPVYMKKGRPGHLLTVLVERLQIDQVINIVFKNSTTFGVRIEEVERCCLRRETKEVLLHGTPITLKIGYWNNKPLLASPEYEECKLVAEKLNLGINEVYDIARMEAKKLLEKGGL